MIGGKKNDPDDPFNQSDSKEWGKNDLRPSFQRTELDDMPLAESGTWSLTREQAEAQIENPSSTLLDHFQLLIQLVMANTAEGVESVLDRAPGLASWKDRKTGLTPLHYAASAGAIQSIDMLIQYGADVFARDRWGRSPMKLAHDAGQSETADCLADEMAQQACSEKSGE
mgnify:CR=1 FL=1